MAALGGPAGNWRSTGNAKMGDVVTGKCVLEKNVDPAREDYLAFLIGKDWHYLPCYARGKPKLGTPSWEYEEREGRLYLTPSLLDTVTKFHTDYAWNVAYEVKPAGVNAFDFFFQINPELSPPP